MKIPGLGCLKGCMTMIIVLAIILVAAWYLGPLHSWYDSGRATWKSVSHWFGSIQHWVSSVGG
jgi:serine/threonine-protein kinase